MNERNSETTTWEPIRPQRGERRYDKHGEFRVMAFVDGWVMARRPQCVPKLFTLQQWMALSAVSPARGK